MAVKLVIPGKLPGLNDYIEAERKHRQQAAKMKKENTRFVALIVKRQLRGMVFDHPVKMKYTWYEQNRRRDKDNVSSMGRKIIQDAMVAAGTIRNDGWAGVDSFEDIFRVDKNNPRIEVLIWEADQNGTD